MSNKYKTILFTSDLLNASRVAFKQAAMLATQFDAKVVLLHVLEEGGIGYEGMLINLFGHDQWQKILKRNTEEAKHALVGKVTPKQMVRTALSELCKENNEEDENFIALNSEIVVEKGNVVDVILDKAAEFKCDLIVMGACKGLLAGNSIGNYIKYILKKSRIPVLVVPESLEVE